MEVKYSRTLVGTLSEHLRPINLLVHAASDLVQAASEITGTDRNFTDQSTSRDM